MRVLCVASLTKKITVLSKLQHVLHQMRESDMAIDAGSLVRLCCLGRLIRCMSESAFMLVWDEILYILSCIDRDENLTIRIHGRKSTRQI